MRLVCVLLLFCTVIPVCAQIHYSVNPFSIEEPAFQGRIERLLQPMSTDSRFLFEVNSGLNPTMYRLLFFGGRFRPGDLRIFDGDTTVVTGFYGGAFPVPVPELVDSRRLFQVGARSELPRTPYLMGYRFFLGATSSRPFGLPIYLNGFQQVMMCSWVAERAVIERFPSLAPYADLPPFDLFTLDFAFQARVDPEYVFGTLLTSLGVTPGRTLYPDFLYIDLGGKMLRGLVELGISHTHVDVLGEEVGANFAGIIGRVGQEDLQADLRVTNTRNATSFGSVAEYLAPRNVLARAKIRCAARARAGGTRGPTWTIGAWVLGREGLLEPYSYGLGITRTGTSFEFGATWNEIGPAPGFVPTAGLRMFIRSVI
jgi:hypothetical protein